MRAQRSSLIRDIGLWPRSWVYRIANQFWRKYFRLGAAVLGLHIRGTDSRHPVSMQCYYSMVRGLLARYPGLRVFVATDDESLLSHVAAHLSKLNVTAIYRKAARGRGGRTNPGVDATAAAANISSATSGRIPGGQVLVDSILLSYCAFLLKPCSAVSEFAIYLNPTLRTNSFDFCLEDGPIPSQLTGVVQRRGPHDSRHATTQCGHSMLLLGNHGIQTYTALH